MGEKIQVTFKIERYSIEIIDKFISRAGLTRSKFLELITNSAAESIGSISTTYPEEVNTHVGLVLDNVRGKATMSSAIEIIEAVFKINHAIGDGDEA